MSISEGVDLLFSKRAEEEEPGGVVLAGWELQQMDTNEEKGKEKE